MRSYKRIIAGVIACTFISGSLGIPSKIPRVSDVSVTTASAASARFNFSDMIDHAILMSCLSDASGDVVVPSTYDGLPVTEISSYAFKDCTDITSVTFPETVTTISYRMFKGCTSLKSVTLPESLTEIPDAAFLGCTTLENINIPKNITSIGHMAFYDTGISEAVVPSTVQSLGESVFSHCPNLKSVTIMDGVPLISKNMFNSCSSLTSIVLPESVKKVDEAAFDECTSLRKIIIESSDCKFADDLCSDYTGVICGKNNSTAQIFASEKNLPFVYDGYYLEPEDTVYTEASVKVSPGTMDFHVFSDHAELYSCYREAKGDIEIPENIEGVPVTLIDTYAFKECKDVTSITVPDTVNEIRPDAFFYCESLEKINIPESVVFIGSEAFYGCSALKDIPLHNRIQYIGDGAFAYCKALKSIKLPDSVNYVPDDAFRSCENLTDVILPKNCRTIGNAAFISCSSLTEISFPSTLESTGYSIFGNCHSLIKLDFPESTLNIDASSFTYCQNLKEVIINNPYCNMGFSPNEYFTGDICGYEDSTAQAFAEKYGYSFKSLNEYDHSDVLTGKVDTVYSGDFTCNVIGKYKIVVNDEGEERIMSISRDYIALEKYNGSDSTVKIPDEIDDLPVKEICKSAFSGKTSLTEINVPSNITIMGSSIFRGCTGLKKAVISADITELPNMTFYDCKNLTEVKLYSEIEAIGEQAFLRCEKLTDINYPKTLRSIGKSAFSECTRLASAELPDGLAEIGSCAFLKCTSLTNACVPASVKSIGNAALGYSEYNAGMDTGIRNYKFTYIKGTVGSAADDYAFENTIGFVDVNDPHSLEYTEVTVGDLTFRKYTDHAVLTDCSDDAAGIVKVPATVDGLPVTAVGIRAFDFCSDMTGVEFPDTITEIGASVFYSCYALKSVDIPDSVTRIGGNAFQFCSSLSAVKLPKNLTKIPKGLLSGCYSLEGVEIPDGVKSIGSCAFNGVRIPEEIVIPDSVETVGTSAFYSCSGLKSMTFPESVKSIDSSVLGQCTNLLDVVIENPDCEIPAIGSNFSNAVIFGQPDSTAQSYAEKRKTPFAAIGEDYVPSGDANGDGKCTVADLVILKNWLLNGSDLKYWLNVDFCRDNKIDVYDFCVFRKMLVDLENQ